MAADHLLAIVNAARCIAADRLERAVRGELPRFPALLASVALDATYAYLKLYGDGAAESRDMGTIRRAVVDVAPDEPQRVVAYHQHVAPSEHGPN